MAGLEVTKIGHSSTPTARLSELQVGSAYQLRLVRSWPLSRAEAVETERLLHRLFSWAHQRGEWFGVDWRDVGQIADTIIAGQRENAMTLAGLLALQAALRSEDGACRRAWYGAKPTERRAAEARARERRAEIAVAEASLILRMLDMGYHPPFIGKHHLQVHNARARYAEIVRVAGAAAG